MTFSEAWNRVIKLLAKISHRMDYYSISKLSAEYLYIWSTQWWARFDHWLLICGTVHSTSPPAQNLENHTLFVFMSFKEVKGKHDIQIDFPGANRNLYCRLGFHFRHSFCTIPFRFQNSAKCLPLLLYSLTSATPSNSTQNIVSVCKTNHNFWWILTASDIFGNLTKLYCHKKVSWYSFLFLLHRNSLILSSAVGLKPNIPPAYQKAHSPHYFKPSGLTEDPPCKHLIWFETSSVSNISSYQSNTGYELDHSKHHSNSILHQWLSSSSLSFPFLFISVISFTDNRRYTEWRINVAYFRIKDIRLKYH